MSNSNLLKVLSFSILFSLSFAVSGIAQQLPTEQPQVNENFTDADYEQFVAINMDLIPLQQDADEKMMTAISDNGLEIERFQQLFQAQQQGNITDASDDPQEIAKFNEAGQQIMKVQEEANQEIQKKITDSGMEVQKFQEMSMAYQQSPKVKQKIDEMIQGVEE
ncbi:DUF4168 domain-containing protein [Lunatibacter salilacus]|uniref:DUF4168 domain-containing protein n=1 Tax=Lunatibacter salilacus TaxID=2483804 RepID=UPI00131D564D|nr:DUF4168 domain-containing protein [Lunatibacter salilacus]